MTEIERAITSEDRCEKEGSRQLLQAVFREVHPEVSLFVAHASNAASLEQS